MESDQWSRVKRILNDFLDEAPDDPEAWLDERCGSDTDLRREVERLLAAYREGDSLEANDAAGWVVGDAEDEAALFGQISDSTDGPDRRIGNYRLGEEIGAGGMSVVYRAERVGEDVEQTVAVKLLQRRLRAGDAERRFRAERQVLASLDHPNVAQFLDGGVTESGRPYLVMEYVDGVPLTDYAEAHDLDLDARLDLLEQVFDAVEAAHRQLVVHRDLKPSNVLVEEDEEGRPRVKLLDFGIAKLLDDSLPVTRPQTQTGHPLMTPEYATPEQVSFGDVSTRTDVYQLGMLAYELLAGTRPFDLAEKSLTEMERIVTEVDPAPPSERSKAVPSDRVKGDLDTILQKALRKEPERRYDSVEALAADVGRYRRDELIEARPATVRYRARKFVRRNATGVGVAAAFLAVLAVAGTMLVRQRNRARQNAERAQRQAETARSVSQFMRGILGPSQMGEYTMSGHTSNEYRLQSLDSAPRIKREIRKSLDRMTEQTDDPRVRGAVLHAGGKLLKVNGLNAWADSLLHRSLALRRRYLGSSHPSVARTLGVLANSKFHEGRQDSARIYLRRYLQKKEQAGLPALRDSARYAISSWHYAVTLQDSARRARRFETALQRVDDVFGPRSEERAHALAEYGDQVTGPTPEFLERAVSIFRERVDSLDANLAYAELRLGADYVATGQVERGLDLARTAIRRFRQYESMGWYQFSRLEYARLLRTVGRLEEARSVVLDVRAWQEENLAPVHKKREFAQHLLGRIAFQQQRYEAAVDHYRRSLEIGTQLYNSQVGPIRYARHFLAQSLIERGRDARAAELLRTNVRHEGVSGKWTSRSRRLLDSLAAASPTVDSVASR